MTNKSDFLIALAGMWIGGGAASIQWSQGSDGHFVFAVGLLCLAAAALQRRRERF